MWNIKQDDMSINQLHSFMNHRKWYVKGADWDDLALSFFNNKSLSFSLTVELILNNRLYIMQTCAQYKIWMEMWLTNACFKNIYCISNPSAGSGFIISDTRSWEILTPAAIRGYLAVQCLWIIISKCQESSRRPNCIPWLALVGYKNRTGPAPGLI